MNISYIDDKKYEEYTNQNVNRSINDPIEAFWESLLDDPNPAKMLFTAKSQSEVQRKQILELIQKGIHFTVNFVLVENSQIEKQYIETSKETCMSRMDYKFTTRLLYTVTINNPKHTIYYKLKWSE